MSCRFTCSCARRSRECPFIGCAPPPRAIWTSSPGQKLRWKRRWPITPEELFAYHAVILDDLEAEFFTRDQMALLQKFVSERGGGLLMLGGAESFQQGNYERTAIGDMLPVYLNHIPDSKPLTNFQF